MDNYKFLDHQGTYTLEDPENYSYLYFPIAGESGIKGAVTPNLGGDIKLDQNTFVMEPVSSENLHNNRSTRNFWCNVRNTGAWSVTGVSAEQEGAKFTCMQDKSELTAGLMWHSITRTSNKYQLESTVTSFVPVDDNVEIMHVTITNIGQLQQEVTPIAAVPIYGRSADNIRDHRHVTSLLHQIQTTDHGVVVTPTLSFDERGHKRNTISYFVCGVSGEGKAPVSFYPIVEDYIGEGGMFTRPRAILEDKDGVAANLHFEGREALGGIRFEEVSLGAGETISYTIVIGAQEKTEGTEEIVARYDSEAKVMEALEQTKAYWKERVNVSYHTGDMAFDNYMKWVSFQPMLRRIYGCSFLPHHDYGKGGRGWRDLWQDCLALLIMNPDGVRQMILDNFRGVRMDGSNATIIGSKPGEFVADRNGITRVWMDHGAWPFLTVKLYMDQTGDLELLAKKVPYFKDRQVKRGMALDTDWTAEQGQEQKTSDGKVYEGTVLEHLLLQHLCSFYEVGEHNHLRLRGADWNDALDMAEERGESVAFTSAYAGNLLELAKYLEHYMERTGETTVELAEEIQTLLVEDSSVYESIEGKKEVLERYTSKCVHNVTGATVFVPIKKMVRILEGMGQWMMEHIRKEEWVTDGNDQGWFNSYYDHNGEKVEGSHENGVRMMLTGQVFTVMSGTATDEQVKSIAEAADHYLYEKEVGGYRLNTNFHDPEYGLGRMFGFAYGEKENGAVFSHMTVMYAYALYKRGFIKEGHKALQTLADTALNFPTSKIYPGIPEYFNAEGRGMYHYLTGAASWYMLTMVTEVFGVRGECGALVVEPKLVKEQFDEEGKAAITLTFAGHTFEVTLENKQHLDYGEYHVVSATYNGADIACEAGKVAISRDQINGDDDSVQRIEIVLG